MAINKQTLEKDWKGWVQGMLSGKTEIISFIPSRSAVVRTSLRDKGYRYNDSFVIGSWGDWVEMHPKKGRSG